MTDKQIIIDDIDVSRCQKQGETIVGITCGNGERIRLANEIITKHKLCKDNHNCVYKQLKRKEQECEELKEIIDDFITDNNYLYSYDGKQPSDLYELQECMQSSMNEFVKYKQILAEIKEIAEGMHDLWINKTPYTDMDNLVKHLLECELNRIRYKLDEISECEV